MPRRRDAAAGLTQPSLRSWVRSRSWLPFPITTALVPAKDAYRDALRAGLEHAIAADAARIVAAEAASTNRRIRALKDRLLPLLEEALAAIELSLDEMERADIDGVRRVIGSRPQPPTG
ncbi:V-type ATP synthase subunit D [Nonomuraea sp. B19D2]|uniref:V-type ATP synthase subunit D n=1 Tax=Nonomuraea sp. B19D2 TaxID=3159561 RepID=UPI0032D9CC16